MRLADREILELNELCGAAVDGTLNDAQRTRLAEWLRDSEAARRYYVRAVGQSASLHYYAAEMHADAPDRSPAAVRPRWLWWVAVPLAAAAAVFIGQRMPRGLASAAPADESVARLTGAKDPQWAGAALAPGAHFHAGQRLELRGGAAEVTFDSGARIVVEGDASLDINSAWDTTLRRGLLKANVPAEAVGFRVSNASVDVVDLGTEFTMLADGKGGADVLVLKGEVEAASRAASQEDTIVLREKEGRRFDRAGVSDLSEPEKKFSLLSEPIALDHFTPALGYVHWSFDEPQGSATSELVGLRPATEVGPMQISSPPAPGTGRITGWRGRALSFDGRRYAQARFPGLSGSTPHTIAFWVRVPADAQLSESFSMVTWGLNSPKLGSRHVGINWNKNPADGPLGAVRTDFRGGHAIGTTSLRDGRWHHISVVFAPHPDGSAVQVHQYVDGRLESSAVTSDTMHAAASASDREAMAELTDVLWLGCRLGIHGLANARFRGDIDELFVADRALEPNEIVTLIRDNRPPNTSLASVR